MRYSPAFRALLHSRRMNFVSLAGLIISLFAAGSFVEAQTIADSNIRISQIYTHGGESGAAYQNDYIELFNRGNVDVDINGWSLNISNFAGTPPNIQISSSGIKLSNPNSIVIAPGKHLLIKFGGSGSGGQPINNPDINLNPMPISEVGGQIVLIAKAKTLPPHSKIGPPARLRALTDLSPRERRASSFWRLGPARYCRRF